ncbi:hypothetical protein HR060_10970 [Catenovulum sp. SM1970]|uniref:hypothetical protein n=1 Tax=Marinifaba aquimaris TaxID=2741323 RepID=UPI0015733CBF|nr:hypothetical protein [Marinifaba aquimaris]NTS77381.1 hypothetical protein [Marinifaba aquimaris]
MMIDLKGTLAINGQQLVNNTTSSISGAHLLDFVQHLSEKAQDQTAYENQLVSKVTFEDRVFNRDVIPSHQIANEDYNKMGNRLNQALFQAEYQNELPNKQIHFTENQSLEDIANYKTTILFKFYATNEVSFTLFHHGSQETSLQVDPLNNIKSNSKFNGPLTILPNLSWQFSHVTESSKQYGESIRYSTNSNQILNNSKLVESNKANEKLIYAHFSHPILSKNFFSTTSSNGQKFWIRDFNLAKNQSQELIAMIQENPFESKQEIKEININGQVVWQKGNGHDS